MLYNIGQLQMQGQGQGQGQATGGVWRQHLTGSLRQAVLKGQTSRVKQLLNEGVPLVTDGVKCISC